MNKKNNCPYGESLWVLPDNKDRGVSEYAKGTFLRNYCNAQGDWCAFDNYNECMIYHKKEKE